MRVLSGTCRVIPQIDGGRDSLMGNYIISPCTWSNLRIQVPIILVDCLIFPTMSDTDMEKENWYNAKISFGVKYLEIFLQNLLQNVYSGFRLLSEYLRIIFTLLKYKFQMFLSKNLFVTKCKVLSIIDSPIFFLLWEI